MATPPPSEPEGKLGDSTIEEVVPSAENPILGVPKPVEEIPAVRTLRPAGKRAALRPGPRPESSDTDDDDEQRGHPHPTDGQDQPPKKRLKASPSPGNDDEGGNEGTDEDDEDEDEDEDSLGDISDEELSKLIIPIQALPSCDPNGPDGSWICQHEGCDFQVKNANAKATARPLILAHLRTHVDIMRTLVNRESRADRPLSHLLDKIETLEQRQDVH